MTESFRAKVDENGRLKIFDLRRFNEALRSVANSDIMISFEKENPKSSVSTKIYWQKVICVEFQKIFKSEFGEHASVEIITNRLISWSPFRVDELGNPRSIESLDQEEFNALIKHVKMIASVEFDTYIED